MLQFKKNTFLEGIDNNKGNCRYCRITGFIKMSISNRSVR